jgi:hypothetical protein
VFGVVAQEVGLFAQPLVGGLGFVVGAGAASGLGAAPPGRGECRSHLTVIVMPTDGSVDLVCIVSP